MRRFVLCIDLGTFWPETGPFAHSRHLAIRTFRLYAIYVRLELLYQVTNNQSIIPSMNFSPQEILILLAAIIAAITVHEFAHAWTAHLLGDDTPYLQGRVTLNPLAHLDPIGSLVFILSGFRFGWGKPVLYNPMRLSRKIDELLIALAGPFSNLLFALLVNLIITGLHYYSGGSYPVLQALSRMNIVLAAFNFIPIPPLDGSSIVAYFWPEYRSIVGSQIGMVAVLILILFPGNLLGLFISPFYTSFSLVTHLFGLIG